MKITFKDIPTGFIKAKVSNIKEKSGAYGIYLQIIFTVCERALKSYKFTGQIKPDSFKQSKFYRWVQTILGYAPDDDFTTEELIGKECLIFLIKKDNYYLVSDVSSDFGVQMGNNNFGF